MAEIVCRHAEDDFFALMTARGMEDANCCVFSIIYIPGAPSMLRWIVWGRFDPAKTTFDKIDVCIKKRLFPADEEQP